MKKLTSPAALRNHLTAHDYTQAWLGRRAGVTRQTIWNLLNRRQSICTDEVAERIEFALALRPGALFTDATLKAERAHETSAA